MLGCPMLYEASRDILHEDADIEDTVELTYRVVCWLPWALQLQEYIHLWNCRQEYEFMKGKGIPNSLQ